MKVVSWLKRIFSLQTVTILISVASCVIAYYAYMDSRSGTISLKWSDVSTFAGDVPDKVQIICFYSNPELKNLRIDFFIPQVVNNTNRQVTGFKLQYTARYYNCTTGTNRFFSKVESRVRDCFDYVYEGSSLPAMSEVALPFYDMQFDSFYNWFTLETTIVHDGIRRPCTYDYYLLNHFVGPKNSPEEWESVCLHGAEDWILDGYTVYIYLNGKAADENKIVCLGPFTKEKYARKIAELGY